MSKSIRVNCDWCEEPISMQSVHDGSAPAPTLSFAIYAQSYGENELFKWSHVTIGGKDICEKCADAINEAIGAAHRRRRPPPLLRRGRSTEKDAVG